MKKIKVLCFNLKKAKHLKDSLNLIKDLLHSSSCDIALLQECQQHKWNSSLVEELADQNWSHYAFAKNSAIGARENGNMILSQFPIVKHENMNLSYSRFLSRGLLWAEIHIPDRDIMINVASAHLGFLPVENRRQSKLVKQQLERYNADNKNFLVGGDFNSWGYHHIESERWQLSPKLKTYPSIRPLLALDRFAFSSGFELVDLKVLGDDHPSPSDHLALLGEFYLRA